MDKETYNFYEMQANVIKALAHPTRLYIIDQLSDSEKCVCEITSLVEADTSTISKHLTILRNAGIVESEKKGSNIYYRLRFRCVLNFFSCTENFIKSLNKKENIEGESESKK